MTKPDGVYLKAVLVTVGGAEVAGILRAEVLAPIEALIAEESAG